VLSSQSPAVPLPEGTWHVDQSASDLGFKSRGMFGLVPVRGTFRAYDGALEVDAAGARGELRIQAATLDTGNEKRDAHLRSADFFDVDVHPTVTFTLVGLGTSPDGTLTLTGVLRIRDHELPVEAPVQRTQLPDGRVRLHTSISVDRAAAGVGWSRMGMVQGPAHLTATVTLAQA
jgi:polyisoprenoid-binding protein YceI